MRQFRQRFWIMLVLALPVVGFIFPMSVGAILTSAATVIVALNAQRLRRLDLTP